MNNPGKYTKIPVEIEAMQWTRDTTMRQMQDFTNDLVKINDVGDEFRVYDRLHDTWVKFDWDDYIIKGIKGEFYPCAKDVFEETYKAVVEEKDQPKKRGGSLKPGAEINIYPAVHVQESVTQHLMRQGLRQGLQGHPEQYR